jgi:hypothetical protein
MDVMIKKNRCLKVISVFIIYFVRELTNHFSLQNISWIHNFDKMNFKIESQVEWTKQNQCKKK